MTGMHLNYVFFSRGTPTATAKATISLPVAATLIQATAVGTNSNAGLLNIGTTTDTDGYLNDFSFGTGNTPAVAKRADFDGALTVSGDPIHFKKDAVVHITISSTSTYPNDPCVVLTFLEG